MSSVSIPGSPITTQEQKKWHGPALLRVVVLSASVAALCALYLILSPPLHADAYEYAGLARSYVTSGELMHWYLPSPGYLSPFLEIPQPAIDRATVWTAIMVPLQALVGDSPWVFLLPFLFGFALLGPAVYFMAKQFLASELAMVAAITLMLIPRILQLSTGEDPGQPNIFMTGLYLLSMVLLLKKRYAFAGLVAGLACLTRITGVSLLPVALVWLFLYRRQEFRRPGPYVFVAIALLLLAPLAARNAAVSDLVFPTAKSNNVITGPADTIAHVDQRLALSLFDYRGEEAQERPVAPLGFSKRAQILLKHLKWEIFGQHSSIAHYPGVIDIMTAVLFPLFLFGAWKGWRNEHNGLLLLFICVQLVGYALSFAYEDRYLFPAVTAAVLVAYWGVGELSLRFPWLNARSVLTLFLLLETAPAVVVLAADAARNQESKAFEKLEDTCSWVRKNTEENAVLMTWPSWSPQYLCNRTTVPATTGDMFLWKEAVDRFEVDYILFYRIWEGDLMPRFSYLEPVVEADPFHLYKVDRSHPDFVQMHLKYAYMKDFGFLDHFFVGRFSGPRVDSLIDALSIHLGSKALAVFLFALVCFSLLRLLHLRRAWVTAIVCIGVVVMGFGVRQVAQKAVGDAPPPTAPPVSRVQIERYIENQRLTARVETIALEAPSNFYEVEEIFSEMGIQVKTMQGDESLRFLHIPNIGALPFGEGHAEKAHRLTVERNQRVARAQDALRARGFQTEVVGGGIFARRRPSEAAANPHPSPPPPAGEGAGG